MLYGCSLSIYLFNSILFLCLYFWHGILCSTKQYLAFKKKKSTMPNFLKFQHEQQKRMEEKQLSSKKEWINSSWIYKKNGLTYKNRQKSDNKNSKKSYFKLKSKKTCLNWQTGDKLVENENAFSQNTILGFVRV